VHLTRVKTKKGIAIKFWEISENTPPSGFARLICIKVAIHVARDREQKDRVSVLPVEFVVDKTRDANGRLSATRCTAGGISASGDIYGSLITYSTGSFTPAQVMAVRNFAEKFNEINSALYTLNRPHRAIRDSRM